MKQAPLFGILTAAAALAWSTSHAASLATPVPGTAPAVATLSGSPSESLDDMVLGSEMRLAELRLEWRELERAGERLELVHRIRQLEMELEHLEREHERQSEMERIELEVEGTERALEDLLKKRE